MADPKKALEALKKKYGFTTVNREDEDEEQQKQTAAPQATKPAASATTTGGRDPKKALEALKQKYPSAITSSTPSKNVSQSGTQSATTAYSSEESEKKWWEKLTDQDEHVDFWARVMSGDIFKGNEEAPATSASTVDNTAKIRELLPLYEEADARWKQATVDLDKNLYSENAFAYKAQVDDAKAEYESLRKQLTDLGYQVPENDGIMGELTKANQIYDTKYNEDIKAIEKSRQAEFDNWLTEETEADSRMVDARISLAAKEQELAAMDTRLQGMIDDLEADYTEEGYRAYVAEYAAFEKLVKDYNGIVNGLPELWNTIAQEKIDGRKTDDSGWATTAKTLQSGIAGVGDAIAQTLDFIMPTEFLGKYDPFTYYSDYTKRLNYDASNRLAESLEGRGKFAQIASEIGVGLIQMAPQFVAALYTGGASYADDLAMAASSATATGGASNLMDSVRRAVVGLSKNPGFYVSAAQTLGNDYDTAKAAGATDAQAAAYALITTYLNAGVEVSGGIQTLPAALREADGHTLLKWVCSSTEEGLEEVVQGIISGTTAKWIYDPDKEVFSNTNEDAIIHPDTLAKEFGLGTAIGGIAGGFQVGSVAAANAINERTAQKAYTEAGQKVRDNMEELIHKGLQEDPKTDAYKLANELQAKETVTDAELGELAYAVQKAENDAIVEMVINDEESKEALLESGEEFGGKTAEMAGRIRQNDNRASFDDVRELMRENQKAAVAEQLAERQGQITQALADAKYGKKGMETFSSWLESSDADPYETMVRFDTPYQVGLTGVEENMVTLVDNFQREAYNAGRMDYLARQAEDAKHKPFAVLTEKESGFDHSGVPADVPQEWRNFADRFLKHMGVKGGWNNNETAYNAFFNPETGGADFAKDFGIDPALMKRLGSTDFLDKVERLAGQREESFLFYVAHEIAGHAAMDRARAPMRAFANAMYNYRQSQSGDENLARFKQTFYGSRNVSLDTDEAIEEVISDSILMLYKDEKSFMAAMDRIMQSTDESAKKGAREYLKGLKEIIAKLKAWARKLVGKENAQVKAKTEQSISELERLRDMFEAAIAQSMKTVQEIRAKGEAKTFEQAQADAKTKRDGKLFRTTEADGTTYLETSVGNPVAMMDENGSAQFSLKTYEAFGRAELRRWLDLRVSKGQIDKADAADMVQQLDEYYEICQNFKDKYAPFGAWSEAEVVRDNKGNPVFSVVKANGEYAMNLDFSLVCKKRRTLDAVFKEMIRRNLMDNVSLEEADIAKVNEIIRESGFETACALCFVDSKRYRQAKVADTFVGQYNDMVRRLLPKDGSLKAHHFDFVGTGNYKDSGTGLHTATNAQIQSGIDALKQVMRENGKQTVAYKIAKHLLDHPQDRRLVSRSEFMNTDGFEAVKIKNPNVLKLYNSSKGAGGPKAAFSDVQYLGDILKKNNFTPDRAYAVGGVRIQSFSDYIPRLVFDYLQMTADLAAKKLPAHAYTKEAIFVKQFGMTGIKMNMSLVPAIAKDGVAPGLDKNGNYFWFDGQSFGSDVKVKGSGNAGFELAKQIQNAPGYSQHCGTIAVGVSDQHIWKMLDDPDIRMIIPYHKSSLNHIVAMLNNIDKYVDYTGVQNTRNADGTKISGKDFNFNEALRRTGDAKAAADEYLAWCEKNGYIPKFDSAKSKFSEHENYYKLLEDFSTYDNGVAAPQGAVTMTFPKKGDAFGSMAELIEEGLDEDAVLEASREKAVPEIVDKVEQVLEKLDDGRKYSFKITEASARAALADVMDHGDAGHDNLVLLGDMPSYIRNLSGIDGELYLYRNHAYENMVSEEEAEAAGRLAPTEKGRRNQHFHAMGEELMVKAILALDEPLIAVADQGTYGNPALSMVLPVFDEKNNPIHAVVGFYADEPINGVHKKRPHIAVTFYGHPYEFEGDDSGRKTITDVVNDAIKEKKVLDFDNKKMRADLPVIAQDTTLGNVTATALRKNVADFRNNVKAFKQKNKIFYSLKGEKAMRREIQRIREEGAKEGKSENEIVRDVMKFAGPEYGRLIKAYGAIEPGENPYRRAAVPAKSEEDRKVSQTVRTILEARVTPDAAVPLIKELVVSGDFSYDVYTDEAAIHHAETMILDKGYANALAEWTKDVEDGKVSKSSTALGWALYNAAASDGDLKTAMNVLNHMVQHQRSAAQALQATRILKKLTPDAQLYGVVQSVQKLEEDLNQGTKFDGETAARASEDVGNAKREAAKAISKGYSGVKVKRNGRRVEIESNQVGEPFVFEYAQKVGEAVAKSIEASRNKVEKQRTFLQQITSELRRFASEKLPKAQKGKQTTAVDLLRDYVQNQEFFYEAWQAAQIELREKYADDPELSEFINSGIGVDAKYDVRNAIFTRALVMAAAESKETAAVLKKQEALGFTGMADTIAETLIEKTGAEGEMADTIRDAANAYVHNALKETSAEDGSKAADAAIRSAMKDIGIKLSEVVLNGTGESAKQAIVANLVGKYGFGLVEATETADVVSEHFEKMSRAFAENRLKSMFKERKVNQKTIPEKIEQLARLGAFDADSAFNQKAAERIFKTTNLTVNEELAKQFLQAKTQEERDAILAEIYQDIGNQMPSTFMDRWNAWRYLAMLGNPRTHVRNVLGNAGFAPVVAFKNVMATGIEAAVSFVSGGKLNRTKAVPSADLLAAAWDDYANVADEISNGGKYNDRAVMNSEIEKGRRIYGRTEQARTKVGKAISATLGKVAEGARKGNSAALEAEDVWFSKPHYAVALAQYCKANNITAEQLRNGKALGNARAYAIKEAQKATYRDTNAFSEMISQMGRYRGDNLAKKGLSLVLEGILPFRKTPANILVRGLEYSPLGLLKSLAVDLAKVGKGKMTGAEAIDNISAGLTGTGLLMLGVLLASEGLIRGAGGGDEDEKEFEKLQGHQNYALELPGGTSVTLDWLAPEALPVFIGVNLVEMAKENKDDIKMSDILTAVSNVTEPLLEMSCLQSLNDVFDSVGYASSNGLAALPSALASAATSYLTQGVPTILGQIERSAEDVRMTTYTEKSAFLTSDMQYALGKISAKIPGWDYNQIPYIDAWGRTESNGGKLSNSANNLLNPAYTSQIETSAMEEELLRLYEATGEASVLPSRAGKYFTVNKERKDLTAEEYVKYATEKGQLSYELVTALTGSAAYRSMTDAEKVEAVGLAYDYANAVAKTKVSEYEPDGWIAKAIATNKSTRLSAERYIALYMGQKDIESLKYTKGSDKGDSIDNSKSLQIMSLVYNTKGLTDVQRKALFSDFGVGKSVVHYGPALVEQKLKAMKRM